MKKILLTILLLIINISNINAEEKNLVNIYLFHSETCSHCQAEIRLLNSLEEKYNNIKVYEYEINNEENQELFSKVKDLYNISNTGVPFTIIGEKYFFGYSDEISRLNFIKSIIYYSDNGYEDKVAKIVGNNNLPEYDINNNQITIDEFINNYGNYKLLFFETDNITMENSNLLLSILSELNIYNVGIIILLLIALFKIKNIKDKIISLILYIGIYILQGLFYNINLPIANNVILLLALNYFVYSILYYIVKENKKHLLYGIVILLSIMSNYLKIHYYNDYLKIFKELLELNTINIFEYIIQILLNTITSLFITMIIIYFAYLIIKIIFKKISQKDIKNI